MVFMQTNKLPYNQLHSFVSSIPLNLAFIFIILGIELSSWIKVILLFGSYTLIDYLVYRFYLKYVCTRKVSKLFFYIMVFGVGLLILILNVSLAILIF